MYTEIFNRHLGEFLSSLYFHSFIGKANKKNVTKKPTFKNLTQEDKAKFYLNPFQERILTSHIWSFIIKPEHIQAGSYAQ